MFHVELRKFPHVTRAFNLTADELQSRIVGPWVRGQAIDLNEHRWIPERARIAIYEGPSLRTDQIGLGRGWANATRTGQDVTARLLAEATEAAGTIGGQSAVEAVASEIVARCAAARIALDDVMAIVNERFARLRASERLAVAEQAIWWLLHQRRVRMLRQTTLGIEPVREEEWEQLLLAWPTWTGSAGRAVLLEGEPSHATTSAINRSRSRSEANR